MSKKPSIKLFLVLQALVTLVATGLSSNYAWGLEPQTAQAYCDEVKQAAQAAQMKYLQTYQPRTNPGKTFDDATLPCLDFITKFKSSLPSLLDDTVLAQVAKQLLQRTCQAARDQFEKSLNEAKQSISGVVGQLPELNQSTAFSMQSDNPMTADTPVFLDAIERSNKRPVVQKTIDRVINMLK